MYLAKLPRWASLIAFFDAIASSPLTHYGGWMGGERRIEQFLLLGGASSAWTGIQVAQEPGELCVTALCRDDRTQGLPIARELLSSCLHRGEEYALRTPFETADPLLAYPVHVRSTHVKAYLDAVRERFEAGVPFREIYLTFQTAPVAYAPRDRDA